MKRVMPGWTSVTGAIIADWEFDSIGLGDLTTDTAHREYARVTERLRDGDREDRPHKLIGVIESIATYYSYTADERVERLRGALAAFNDLAADA